LLLSAPAPSPSIIVVVAIIVVTIVVVVVVPIVVAIGSVVVVAVVVTSPPPHVQPDDIDSPISTEGDQLGDRYSARSDLEDPTPGSVLHPAAHQPATRIDPACMVLQSIRGPPTQQAAELAAIEVVIVEAGTPVVVEAHVPPDPTPVRTIGVRIPAVVIEDLHPIVPPPSLTEVDAPARIDVARASTGGDVSTHPAILPKDPVIELESPVPRISEIVHDLDLARCRGCLE